jgi:HSP20 family protein
MTRYEPQTTLARLPDLVDRLFQESFVMPSFFDRTWSKSAWPVNLFETPESYIMHVAIPGLTPDHLNVQVVGREVSIQGKIELSTPEKGNWIWQGIPAGEFSQTFTLPVEVDGDGVEATYDYGILTLGLPKAAHLRPKNIEIKIK